MCEPGPDAAASQAYVHWTQVAPEIGAESWHSRHSPSIATSTFEMPRSGAHATPAIATRPAGTLAGARDVDARLGQDRASFDQPSGTQ